MLEPSTEDLKTEHPGAVPDKHHANQQGDVIYVLRTTQQHHVMLSMIADQKANIILGAFLIFITVTQKISGSDENLGLSMWVLTGFFTLSALFALMVIAPRFRNKKTQGSNGNLLFFGSFSQMAQEDYIEQLNAQLQDNTQARHLMMKDIYQIGQILDKKYNNLRYSYIALALGIISSVLAFSALQLL